MLIDCLLVAYLIILPAEGKPHYEAPIISCAIRTPTEMYINEAHHLIIEQRFVRYDIPLVRHDGKYEIRYTLGEEYARYRRVDIEEVPERVGEALVDRQCGRIMARFGPKEEY